MLHVRPPRLLPSPAGRAALVAVLAATLVGGCAARRSAGSVAPLPASGIAATPNTLTPDERAAGWRLLFDGRALDGWTGYGRSDLPAGWQIEGDALAFVPGGEGGDAVVPGGPYGDFELALEWKIQPCGNSGIFYRGAEGHEAVWASAPEMQVLDDACHPDARYPSHRAGSNYDLHAATPGAVRPAGEWNQARIVAQGPHVEHWLNGVEMAEYEQGSPDWTARVAASKFREMPDYGRAMSGVIALQDHGDRVWYRNLKIRPIE